MYVFVKHVHESYITRTCFRVNKLDMMTYVCVMYVFSKHVHALNLLIISIITSHFMVYVRVWRLILKKKSLSPYDLVAIIASMFSYLRSLRRL